MWNHTLYTTIVSLLNVIFLCYSEMHCIISQCTAPWMWEDSETVYDGHLQPKVRWFHSHVCAVIYRRNWYHDWFELVHRPWKSWYILLMFSFVVIRFVSDNNAMFHNFKWRSKISRVIFSWKNLYWKFTVLFAHCIRGSAKAGWLPRIINLLNSNFYILFSY